MHNQENTMDEQVNKNKSFEQLQTENRVELNRMKDEIIQEIRNQKELNTTESKPQDIKDAPEVTVYDWDKRFLVAPYSWRSLSIIIIFALFVMMASAIAGLLIMLVPLAAWLKNKKAINKITVTNKRIFLNCKNDKKIIINIKDIYSIKCYKTNGIVVIKDKVTSNELKFVGRSTANDFIAKVSELAHKNYGGFLKKPVNLRMEGYKIGAMLLIMNRLRR